MGVAGGHGDPSGDRRVSVCFRAFRRAVLLRSAP
jgi:hypothetical protein